MVYHGIKYCRIGKESMVNSVFMGPGSWASKRELKKRDRYVGLYHPGPVYVNHLEIERKQEEARLKQERKQQEAALRQAKKDEFIAAKQAKQEEKAIAKQIKREEKAELKAQRKAQRQELSTLDRIHNFAKGLFSTFASKTTPSESDFAVAQSLEDSAVEFDVERRDAMIEALKQGRYEEFRNSEFAKMPLDELYALFDFDGYEYINEPEKILAEEHNRVIGKPRNIRKNKSLTLNYLRKNSEINVKQLLEYMKEEEFGTVIPNSADDLLDWANCRNGVTACPRVTSDVGHNCLLRNLQMEIKSAYDSLHAPKTGEEKILVFPNGEKCEMSAFLAAA